MEHTGDINVKYFIYCRKSSEARDKQALSIEAQKRELNDYARQHNLKIVEVFDESQSAYKEGRPIFHRMMGLIEEGIANGILTWRPDRLARNAIDGGRVINDLDKGILREIRTPSDLYRQEDNRVMLWLAFGMSNDLSRQISANVKRGNRQKYARGEFVGKAPLGYLNAEVGHSRNIVIDPDKGPLVKRLFEEYATGKYSVMDMSRKADVWGLTSVYKHKLPKSEMYRLLQRTAYYGVFVHNREPHNGMYEPLISKELFDRAQEVLKGRSTPRKQSWVHAYKGLIKCGGCGCFITAETKTKHYKRTARDAAYTYYRCTRRRGRCSQPGVTESELEAMIADYVNKITIDREVWELGVELLKAKNSDEFDRQAEVRANAELELAKLDRTLQTLLELRLSEEVTADEYAAQKKKYIDQRIILKERLEDREQSTSRWLELAENFFETAFSAREILEKGDAKQKHDLVQTVGWNLILGNGKLGFSFKKPYDALLQPALRTDVQGRRESNPQ